MMFQDAGSFPVTLMVKNQYGCTDSITKVVVVEPEFTLYIPNAFSPNADGLNEVFIAQGEGIENFKMEIFDRWGENIFNSDNLYAGWDGTYKGRICKVDTYVWRITVSASKTIKKVITGTVTLIR